MEYMTEPSALRLCRDLRNALESQKSIRSGLQIFTLRQLRDPFSVNLIRWVQLIGHNSEVSYSERRHLMAKFNIYQRTLLLIVENGLAGHSVSDQLMQMENEFHAICLADIAKHTATLPFRLQIPLLLFILPAILILIIVPALNLMAL